MMPRLIRLGNRLRRWLYARHAGERVEALRTLGMHIGEGVALPASTWIDESHCFLISIGDDCGFGERCMILAHDAQMNEFVNATRLGRVILHASCHIGSGTLIMPGVELGPRTIVGAGSVVSRSLPPETVCGGNPARVICSLADYLRNHRQSIEKRPRFPYREFKDVRALTVEQKAEMLRAVADGDAYITGAAYEQPQRSTQPEWAGIPTLR